MNSEKRDISLNLMNVVIWGVLALLGVPGVFAQVADGACRPEKLTLKKPVHQIAPELTGTQIEMPGTVRPPEQKRTDAIAQPADLEIGYLRLAPPGVLTSAPWHRTQDGSGVCRVELRSKNATGLRVVLTDIGDMELRVYDPVGGSAFGPYRYPRLSEDGTWWSTVIFGEAIGLEFYLPPRAPLPPEKMPEIQSVFYMYADFQPFLSQAKALDDCHLDAVCYPDWINSIEGRAIGLLMCSTGCTGALMNRSPQDFAPILMTARHCINTQTEANNLCVIWFYQTDSCPEGTAPSLNTLPRNDGTLLLKTNQDSDWTLLGLYDPPGTNCYVGWDSHFWDTAELAVGINHPGGQPKRISFGFTAPLVDTFSCSAVGSDNQWLIFWDDGRIGPGASGSPIYDSNRRVRGTLSCGAKDDACSDFGLYGRLDTAFSTLKPYLYQTPSPVYVDGAFSGDPGNAGSSEQGTAPNPFNTVYEATFSVRTGDQILIRAGTYNERFQIQRAMTLKADGGTVTIGPR